MEGEDPSEANSFLQLLSECIDNLSQVSDDFWGPTEPLLAFAESNQPIPSMKLDALLHQLNHSLEQLNMKLSQLDANGQKLSKTILVNLSKVQSELIPHMRRLMERLINLNENLKVMDWDPIEENSRGIAVKEKVSICPPTPSIGLTPRLAVKSKRRNILGEIQPKHLFQ